MLPKVLLLSTLVLVGLGGVYLASLGSVMGVTLISGSVVAGVLLMLPLNLLLLLTLVLNFVAVGGLGYFTKNEAIYWVPYLMALLLYFRFLIELLLGRGRLGGRPASPSVILLVLFTLVGITSGLVNNIGFGTWVLATKHYVLLWGALFVLQYSVRDERVFDWMWRAVLGVALFQVPVVLYQYIAIGGRLRAAGGAGADAVSGSMGGGELGGSSAALSFLVVTALLVAIGLYRSGLMKARYLFVAMLSVLAVLALAEVKAAVLILLPLGLIFMFWRHIMLRPLAFIVSAAFYGIIVIGIFTGYQILHRGVDSTARTHTALEAIERALDSETDTTKERFHSYDLGRTALLKFWFTEHQRASLVEILVGHGPAATRIGRFSAGDVAIRFQQYGLRKTSISILLWEVGVIGLLLMLLIFIISAIVSKRLSRDESIPAVHRTYLEVGSAVLFLLAVSIFYSRYPIDAPHIQLLSMLCLGQIGYWQARVWQDRRLRRDHTVLERPRHTGVRGAALNPRHSRLLAASTPLQKTN